MFITGDKLQGHLLEIVIPFIIALLMIYFRDWFAKYVIDSQNTLWGTNYGEREIKATKFVAIAVACVIIILDILALLGVIKFR